MFRGWSQSGCWRWAWRTMPPSRRTSGPRWCSKGLPQVESSVSAPVSLPENQQKPDCLTAFLLLLLPVRHLFWPNNKRQNRIGFDMSFLDRVERYIFAKWVVCLLDLGLALLLGSVFIASAFIWFMAVRIIWETQVTCSFQSLTFRRITYQILALERSKGAVLNVTHLNVSLFMRWWVQAELRSTSVACCRGSLFLNMNTRMTGAGN